MATTDDRTVLLDTNVLLSATAPSRFLHPIALRVLNEWPNRGFFLVTSPQVFREYLVVATRPAEVNGLALDLDDALANVAALRRRVRLLPEGEEALGRLHELVTAHRCLGKQIHDANLVATALAAGVTRILTGNPRDFARFSSEIEVVDLAALSEERASPA